MSRLTVLASTIALALVAVSLWSQVGYSQTTGSTTPVYGAVCDTSGTCPTGYISTEMNCYTFFGCKGGCTACAGAAGTNSFCKVSAPADICSVYFPAGAVACGVKFPVGCGVVGANPCACLWAPPPLTGPTCNIVGPCVPQGGI